MGQYYGPSELLGQQLKIVKDFLSKISKQTGDDMATTKPTEATEKKNMVFLAGNLKFDPKVFDDNTRCLIDVGMKSCIQCTIYTGQNSPSGNAELASKLKRFAEGDFIQVVCILRPYGVKKDSGWVNNVSVDITNIKNDPPQRQQQNRGRSDDDLPF